jgi:hypothetical protein
MGKLKITWKIIIYTFSLFLFYSISYTRENGTITGQITPPEKDIVVSAVFSKYLNQQDEYEADRSVRPGKPRQWYWTTQTDDKGNYQLTLPQGEYQIGALTKIRKVENVIVVKVLGGKEIKGQDMTIIPYGSITGTIQVESDDTVFLEPRKWDDYNFNGSGPYWCAKPLDGKFFIPSLTIGEYKITLISMKHGVYKEISHLVPNGKPLSDKDQNIFLSILTTIPLGYKNIIPKEQWLDLFSTTYQDLDSMGRDDFKFIQEYKSSFDPKRDNDPWIKEYQVILTEGNENTAGILCHVKEISTTSPGENKQLYHRRDRMYWFVKENNKWKFDKEQTIFPYSEYESINFCCFHNSLYKTHFGWMERPDLVHYFFPEDAPSWYKIKITENNKNVMLDSFKIPR